MYKIVLTHGRGQEIASGPAFEVAAGNGREAQAAAVQAMMEERNRRHDGLPDGYLVFDERGKQVAAEWIGLRHA